MKTHEWFVVIDYGKVKLLIPQSVVVDTFSAQKKSDEIKSIMLDELISETFISRKLPSSCFQAEGNISKLLISADEFFFIVTKAKVSMENLALSEFSMLHDFMNTQFSKRGIDAFRFSQNSMQLLINVKAVLQNGISKNFSFSREL